jgi:hypothetical protein
MSGVAWADPRDRAAPRQLAPALGAIVTLLFGAGALVALPGASPATPAAS